MNSKFYQISIWFKGSISIGLMLWFLAREVLRIRGQLSRTEQWDVMPDLFFHRDHDEAAKEEHQQAAETQEFDQNQNAGHDQEWDQNGTTIGQAVQLQSGFAANEDWNPAEENWSKGATTDSWSNQPVASATTTWSN